MPEPYNYNTDEVRKLGDGLRQYQRDAREFVESHPDKWFDRFLEHRVNEVADVFSPPKELMTGKTVYSGYGILHQPMPKAWTEFSRTRRATVTIAKPRATKPYNRARIKAARRPFPTRSQFADWQTKGIWPMDKASRNQFLT